MKKSLINCIAECRALGKSEDEAIIVYLNQDGILTDDMFDIIYGIFKNNHRKLIHFYDTVMANMAMDNGHYYAKYDFETARKLDSLTRRMQMNHPFDKEDFDFMQEFDISRIKGAFWHDLCEVIKGVQDPNYLPQIFGTYTHPITPTQDDNEVRAEGDSRE